MIEPNTQRFSEISNREEVFSHVHSLHNQIGILSFHELFRVIGFHEDPRDFYYHVVNYQGEENYHSCVGGFIRLKGSLSDLDYNFIDQCFELNGGRKREFVISRG